MNRMPAPLLIVLLAAAVLAGDSAWIRVAGTVLALGALAFTVALARVLGHLRLRSPAHVAAFTR